MRYIFLNVLLILTAVIVFSCKSEIVMPIASVVIAIAADDAGESSLEAANTSSTVVVMQSIDNDFQEYSAGLVTPSQSSEESLFVLSSSSTTLSSEKPTPSVAFKFVALGDSRGSTNGINEATVIDMKNGIIDEGDVAFVLFTGDMTTLGMTEMEEYFYSLFVQPLKDTGINFYGIAGNHEYISGDFSTFLPDLTLNGPSLDIFSYSFTYKNALFLGFDWKSNDLEQAWVEQQVENAGATHIFAMSHKPIWQTQHSEVYTESARDSFIDYMVTHGGRTFFAGHDHFYDHSKVTTSSGIDFHQYVVGTAGAPLRNWTPEYGRSDAEQVRFESLYGYSVITIQDSLVSIVFKKQKGVEFIPIDTLIYTVSSVQ